MNVAQSRNKPVRFFMVSALKGAVCQKPILTEKRLGYQTVPFSFL
jgi:hypothetical protein